MSRSKKQRSHLRQALRFESLESRRVMTLQVLNVNSAAEPTAVQLWADRFAAERQAYAQTDSTEKVLHFDSQQEAQDALVDALLSQWRNVLGVSIDGQTYSTWPSTRFFEDSRSLVSLSSIPGVTSNMSANGPIAGLSNVQTVGVDEADRFKVTSDGFAYIVSNTGSGPAIVVIDARDPKNLITLSQIELGAYSAEMHLVGDQLIVVKPSTPDAEAVRSSNGHVNDIWKTQVDVYDISDKSHPALQSSTSVPGVAYSSRFTENGLVLYGSRAIEGMRPKFIADDPNAVFSTLPSTSIGHFETAEEFAARIRPLVLDWYLPQISTTDADGATVESDQVADWSDININNEKGTFNLFGLQLVVSSFVLSAQGLKAVDTEVLVGAGMVTDYADADTLYVAEPDWFRDAPIISPIQTRISAFQFDANGVEFLGRATVPGTIRDSRMMDEYQGNLRIFTDSVNWARSDFRGSADLYILSPQDGELKVIGQLTDVADGQSLYSANFNGSQAFITTWLAEIPMDGLLPTDPLHAFDLSDPKIPVELSELIIPGVTTYLHRVDANHLIGLGYVQQNNAWHYQVSLYDVSDKSKMSTVDVWISTEIVSPQFRVNNPETLAVHYDAASGVFSVSFSALNGSGTFNSSDALAVFQFSPDDPDPLQLIGTAGQDRLELWNYEVWSPQRSAVVGETLFVMTEKWFESYSMKSFSKPLDRLLITSPAIVDQITVYGKETKVIDVLANDLEPNSRLLSVGESLIGATVTMLPDGKVSYIAPESKDSVWAETIEYKAMRANGETYTGSIWIQLLMDPGPTDDRYSSSSARVLVAIVDADGKPVSSVTKGTEYWLEVQATDGRDTPQGIFAAFVDLTFDPSELTVTGSIEPLGSFSTGKLGTVESGSISAFGGFSSSVAPSMTAKTRVARIQVRAEVDGLLNLNAIPSANRLADTLLYGESKPLAPWNVTVTASPTPLPTRTIGGVTSKLMGDINGDGERSPLDAYLVVQFLNQQSASLRDGAVLAAIAFDKRGMDVSGDGEVSPLDAFMIVNGIIADQALLVASGEEVASAHDADVVSLLASDISDIDSVAARRRRSGN